MEKRTNLYTFRLREDAIFAIDRLKGDKSTQEYIKSVLYAHLGLDKQEKPLGKEDFEQIVKAAVEDSLKPVLKRIEQLEKIA